jgi:hypothetical protein
VIQRVQEKTAEDPGEGAKNYDLAAVRTIDMTASTYFCSACGNKNQENFINDGSSGDTICNGKDNFGCGNVVQNHAVDLGQQFRVFAGIYSQYLLLIYPLPPPPPPPYIPCIYIYYIYIIRTLFVHNASSSPHPLHDLALRSFCWFVCR